MEACISWACNRKPRLTEILFTEESDASSGLLQCFKDLIWGPRNTRNEDNAQTSRPYPSRRAGSAIFFVTFVCFVGSQGQ